MVMDVSCQYVVVVVFRPVDVFCGVDKRVHFDADSECVQIA